MDSLSFKKSNATKLSLKKIRNHTDCSFEVNHEICNDTI